METWQERLKQEAIDLDSKIEKLLDFITGDKIDELDPANRALLNIQFEVMQAYAKVLDERIELNNL